MNVMRKQILLLFAMAAAMMPVSLSAYDFEEGGIYYDVNGSEATVTRAGVNVASYSGDVVIPEKVIHNGEEYAVTEIGYSAFSYCYGLSSIEIPIRLSVLGNMRFYIVRVYSMLSFPTLSLIWVGVHFTGVPI